MAEKEVKQKYRDAGFVIAIGIMILNPLVIFIGLWMAYSIWLKEKG